MTTKTSKLNYSKNLLIYGSMLLILSVDIYTPRGFNESHFYLIAILATIWISERNFTIIISIIAVLLTVIGLYYSPEGVPFKIATINRLYVVAEIFAAGYIIVKYKETVKINQFQAAKLEKNVKNLKHTNNELKTFSYVASHDMQEPLRMIKMFSQKIVAAEKFSEKTQSYFNFIVEATNRMHDLIVSLINYSSIDNSQLNFVPCDLNDVVDESIRDQHLKITERQVSIEYDTLPTIKGMPIQLYQLFTNLISNSIKYCRPEIKPNIKITSQRLAGNQINHHKASLELIYYVIKITDNGIGFDSAYASTIFEPFKRLHTRDEFTGTGIGLSIVKKIVSNHNGFITAESELGVGSTFTIYLPV